MKTTKSLLAALIFLTSVTASVKAFAADGVVEKDPFAAGSYCHQSFSGDDEPEFRSRRAETKNSADVVDFYGECNETPVGQDQVQEQKLELQHRFTRDYED